MKNTECCNHDCNQGRDCPLRAGKAQVPPQQPDAHAKAAIATLTSLGYTWIGGEQWKPPIGKAPDFNLLDAKNARIAELEDQLAAAPQAVQKCEGCNGHGLVGGLLPGDGGYESEECPFCKGSGDAAPAHPAEGVPAQAFKTKVFQALGIGSACNEDAVFVNIENARRRADCLSAIEREFFMVETPPDESEGDTEPGEECLLNWGHTPTQYVQQFAKALAATQPAAKGMDAPWIHVSERLPELRQQVLAGYFYQDTWLKGRPWVFSVGVCSMYENPEDPCFPQGKRWQTHGCSHNDIAYWMPMPKSPELPKAIAAQAKQGGA